VAGETQFLNCSFISKPSSCVFTVATLTTKLMKCLPSQNTRRRFSQIKKLL